MKISSENSNQNSPNNNQLQAEDNEEVSPMVRIWKENDEQPLMCPYCKSLDNPAMQHDHYLTYLASNKRKAGT